MPTDKFQGEKTYTKLDTKIGSQCLSCTTEKNYTCSDACSAPWDQMVSHQPQLSLELKVLFKYCTCILSKGAVNNEIHHQIGSNINSCHFKGYKG